MRRSSPIGVFIALVLAVAGLALPASAVSSRTHKGAHAKAAPSKSGKNKASRSAKPAGRARAKAARKAKAPARAKAAPSARTRRELRTRRRSTEASPVLQQASLAMPPPLRGSHESLVHQNEMAEADGLERILDDADLEDRIAHGSLVPVPVSAAVQVNTNLPENRRYCRPWTAKFLSDMGQAHAAHFPGNPLEVTSAVRTVEYQRQLRHVNGNAAAADGDVASPHLTGGTIDLGKQGLSAREIGWLRAWLLPLEQAGKIDVEEEFHQACFHISVYKSYVEPKPVTKPSAPLSAAIAIPTQGR